MMQATESLWSMKDAMAYLRVSRSTLLRLIEKKAIPAFKLGVGWRFHPEEVKAQIKKATPYQASPTEIEY